MAMTRVEAWLPVWCNARFTVEIPDEEYGSMEKDEIREYLYDNGDIDGELCTKCSRNFDTDNIVDWDSVDDDDIEVNEI